ncbi:hypothetical protein Vi05172_g11228 [Venturia inaequalis]|nr:hypothetical protein Vi05172_g11228 [Venturia inaequalis]
MTTPSETVLPATFDLPTGSEFKLRRVKAVTIPLALGAPSRSTAFAMPEQEAVQT